MLNEALKKAGITKMELSEIMGVSRKTVTRMGDELTPEVERALELLSHPAPPFSWQDIPISKFDGKGRGVPVDGFVLVSQGWVSKEDGLDLLQEAVTEKDWRARLEWTCPHDLKGWSCKKCL